jgi:hypothetical protein
MHKIPDINSNTRTFKAMGHDFKGVFAKWPFNQDISSNKTVYRNQIEERDG